MRNVKQVVAGGAVATVALLGLGMTTAAGVSGETPSQDAQYVACVASEGIYNNQGPSTAAALGRSIANDIALGLRTPLEEQYWVYYNTPASITQYDANVIVNCATSIYLGYGPPVWNDGGAAA